MVDSEFQIKVGVKVDTDAIQAQLNNINSKKPIEIDVKLSDASLKNISNQINHGFKNKKTTVDVDFKADKNSVNKVAKETVTSLRTKVNKSGSEINKLEAKIKQLGASSTQSMRDAIDSLRKLKDGFGDINYGNLEKASKEYRAFADIVKDVSSEIEEAQSKMKLDSIDEKLDLKRRKYQNLMDSFMKDNPKMRGSIFEKEYMKIRLDLDTSQSEKELDNLMAKARLVQQSAKINGKTGDTLLSGLGKNAKSLLSYASAAGAIYQVADAFRAMFQNVLEVDTAMTELKRVTDLSSLQYENLYNKLTVSAKEYGVQLTDLISATADWSRAGFDADTAAGLAEITSVYQHISDLDYSEASENLLTAYKGFEQQLTQDFKGNAIDAVGYVSDVFNELDNNYAVTAAGVGEALKRSASALQIAGNTFQESAAMVTGIAEVTQDPEKAGNALKVVSMRLRGMKGDLEGLGEDVDENVTNLSKMQGQILNLTKGKVNIFDDMGQFKSTYDILQGISDVWNELNSTDQATLLETIAGKHRANDIAAIIGNWQNVEKAAKSAAEAEGSAMEEQAKYADSIQGRLNSLQAMWQEFSNTFLDSNLVKFAVSALTEILKVIESIIDAVGGIGTAGLIGALFMGARGINGISGLKNLGSMFSELKTIGYLVASGTKSFGELKAAGAMAGQAIGESFKSTGSAIAAGIGVALAVVGAAIQFYDDCRRKIEETRQENIDLSNGFDDAFGGFEQAYIKYADKTLLTTEEENELASAIDGTISALGDKSTALRDAVGASSEYAANLDKIAKAELKQSQSLSLQALSDSRARLNDWGVGDNPGQADWGTWLGSMLSELPVMQELRGLFTGVTFSKNSNVDFALGKKTDKAYKAIEEYIQKGKKLGNIKQDLVPEFSLGLFGNDEGFIFDNVEEDFDGYIQQVEYIQGMIDELNRVASETGDNSYLDSDLYKNAKESLNTLLPYMEEYTKQTYNAEKAQYQLQNGIAKNVEEFNKMRDSVLKSSSDSIAGRVAVGDLMNNEYQDMFDLSSIESQMNYIKSVTDGIVKLKSTDMGKFETVLDLKTTVNNGEGTVGDYIDALETANDAIGKIADEDAQEFLRVQLGLELDADGKIDDDIKHMRDKLVNSMKKSGIGEDVAAAFADDLSATQLKAVVDGDVEIDWKHFDRDKAMKQIKDVVKINEALSFDIAIEDKIKNLENLNAAAAQALSGTGLDTEMLENVERMFAGLSSYDPAKLFERTANGIRLNTDELRRMNNEYANENISGLNEKMSVLGDEYNRTKSELADLTYGTEEYNAKAKELSALEKQINDTEKLAAQYEGLTSAYNQWQMAESAGNQRDMYESILSGFETVEDELSRGWVDDGTIEFIELLSGKDLSSGKIEDIKSAWSGLDKTIKDTTYSVKDFFTTNKDGESTSDGVYNFLDAVGQLEEEAFGGKDVVQRDGKGNIIGFDFQIAGGDEAIAEALGVSEELVQIMVRAADDAGFVVSMDGTYQQLDILKEKAAEAALALKDTFKATDYTFFQDGSAEGVLNDYNEAVKVWEGFKKNKNADGTVNMDVEGAEEAFTLVSTLQSMVDQLNEPVYMDINTSDVETEMQKPLSKLQEYERLTQTEHQLKLKGTDTSQIDESQEEILDYFEGLEPEVKAKFGIDNLSREQLQEKLEAGEIEVPATVDLQVEMNDTLKDMVNVALFNAGVIDDKELEARVDVSLYAKDVDASDVKDKTEKAVKNAGKDEKKTESTTDVEVKAGKVDASDVKNKTEEAVNNVKEKYDNVEKSVDLEVKIDEYNELIENLEDADKDIKINVSVKGMDQVKELNQNIDLATKIDGDINNLSEFVEGAKELSKLDSSIATYVTAEVSGNVIKTPEFEINNLKTFAESSKDLKSVGSPTSNVTANVEGNVIDKFEYQIDNLKKFTDSAKDIKSVGSDTKAKVTANIEGNVTDTYEYKIDNLKKFTDSAKDIKSIGSDTKAKITADVEGNVIDTYEYKIDNLKKFTDSVKDIKSIGSDVKAKVTADIDGNVIGTYEYKIDNLKAFTDSAKDIKSIGKNTKAKVTADVDGNVIDTFEYQIDNLKKFTDSAEDIQDIGGDVKANVTANVDGNVVDTFEYKIDNLKKFTDSAKDIDNIGSNTKAKVTADVEGNVVDTYEYKIDNLKKFTDSAKDIKSIGDNTKAKVTANVEGNVTDTYEYKIDNLKAFVESARGIKSVGSDTKAKVTADVEGNVVDTYEYKIDNLKSFVDNAKGIKSIGSDVKAKVTADIEGNVADTYEYKIDNLKAFTDSAKDIKSIGSDTKAKVTANVEGNVIDTYEYKIDNLKAFTDSAKDIKSIGSDTKSKVTADVEGNVITTPEYMIDNLKAYSDSANNVASIGVVSSSVSANVSGNVINTAESSIDNIGVYADNASKLKNVGSPTSTATANIESNVTDANISTLKSFNGIATALKSVGSVVVSVTANVATQAINSAINLLSSIANGGLFKDYKADVQVTAKVSSVDDAAVQNYQAPSKDGKVIYTVDSSQVDSWVAPDKTGTVNYSAHVEALTSSQKYKTGTITYKAKVEGAPVVNGTAHVNGTAGRAFKQGSWSTKESGTALMGELGQELIVRDGRFFTVGDNGAEFAQYKKGDIIFNHKQTEELFKNGYVISGGGRGKAFAGGSTGSGGWGRPGTGNTVINNYNYNVSSGSSKSTKSSSSSTKKSTEEAEKFEEVLDWIEIAIDRIERAIKNLNTAASSTFRSWSERTDALNKQIAETRNEIDLQQRAYERYMQAANEVGLDAGWAQKIRDGKVDIELITDEDLKEKIDQYREWYDKALDARDALLELQETESELYMQRFQNISDKFDGRLGVIQHEKDMLDEFISQSEASGYLTSKKYYEALYKNTQNNIAELKKQRDEMTAEMNAAVDSGAVEKYSQSW